PRPRARVRESRARAPAVWVPNRIAETDAPAGWVPSRGFDGCGWPEEPQAPSVKGAGGPGLTPAYQAIFAGLYRRFRVSSYKLVRTEQNEEVIPWLRGYQQGLAGQAPAGTPEPNEAAPR